MADTESFNLLVDEWAGRVWRRSPPWGRRRRREPLHPLKERKGTTCDSCSAEPTPSLWRLCRTRQNLPDTEQTSSSVGRFIIFFLSMCFAAWCWSAVTVWPGRHSRTQRSAIVPLQGFFFFFNLSNPDKPNTHANVLSASTGPEIQHRWDVFFLVVNVQY